jgi:hypothetical protein
LMDLTAGTPVPSYAPTAPGSVAITVNPGVTPTTNSMTVTWVAPTSSGATGISYYTVSIYQGGALVTSGTVNAPALTGTLSSSFNLASTAVFYATVTATNSSPVGLTGPAGQSINYTWAVVPAAPSGVSVAVPGSDTPSVLTVSWTPPPVAVLPLTQYTVLVYQGGNPVGEALGVSPGVNSYNVPPITGYNLATVREPISAQVTAINSYGASTVGTSPGYNWYDPVLPNNPLTASPVDETDQTCSFITANWTAPQVYAPGETITVRLRDNTTIDISSPALAIGTTSYQFSPTPPASNFYVGKFNEIRWSVTVTASTGASASRSDINLTTN